MQDTYCNFNVTWVTSAACDLPDAPGRPSSLASDWGTHFLLIFFGAVIVYCGLGTFIKSRLPNHSDACYNNIPQRDFWFDLPSLASGHRSSASACNLKFLGCVSHSRVIVLTVDGRDAVRCERRETQGEQARDVRIHWCASLYSPPSLCRSQPLVLVCLNVWR